MKPFNQSRWQIFAGSGSIEGFLTYLLAAAMVSRELGRFFCELAALGYLKTKALIKAVLLGAQ
jgi:hypothetical protein